jgi:hypothetical protein
MITAKIKDVKKDVCIADNTPFLDVHFELLDDGEVVAERRHGFSLDTPEEAIADELGRYCTMWENDHKLAADAEKRAEAEKEADKVIEGLMATPEISPKE